MGTLRPFARTWVMEVTNDALAAKKLSALLKTLPPDPIERVLGQARAVPADWRNMRVADIVRRLRRRFGMTQRQLAALSGLPHPVIARIEGGRNIRLSTLYQLFAGFGCDLVLLPVSRLARRNSGEGPTIWSTAVLCREDAVIPDVNVLVAFHWLIY